MLPIHVLLGHLDPWRNNRLVIPKRWNGITTLCCIQSQKIGLKTCPISVCLSIINSTVFGRTSGTVQIQVTLSVQLLQYDGLTASPWLVQWCPPNEPDESSRHVTAEITKVGSNIIPTLYDCLQISSQKFCMWFSFLQPVQPVDLAAR